MRAGVDGGDEIAAWPARSTRWSPGWRAPRRAPHDLVAAVSHDLRTPLTSLRLLAEALDDDIVDDGDRAAYLAKHAHPRAARWRALIDDLFELSRLQAGELAWTMEQVRLDELVRRDGRGDAPTPAPRGSVRRRAG